MKRAVLLMLVLLVAGAAAYFATRTRGSASESFIRASGRVGADSVSVAARAPGRVAALLAEVGDPVTRGQFLAHIDAPTAPTGGDDVNRSLAALEAKLRSEEAALAVMQARVPLAIRAAETSLDLARAVADQAASDEQEHAAEVERLKAVTEPSDEERAQLGEAEEAHEHVRRAHIVARAAVADAESDLALARLGEQEIAAMIAEVEALRAERDGAARHSVAASDTRTSVLSPVSGTVVAREASEGFSVEAGATLFEIVAPEAIHVVAVVSQRQLAFIAPGQDARLYPENAPDAPIDAKVSGIIAGQGENAASWMVRLTPRAPGAQLVIGARAEVVIRTRADAPWPE